MRINRERIIWIALTLFGLALGRYWTPSESAILEPEAKTDPAGQGFVNSEIGPSGSPQPDAAAPEVPAGLSYRQRMSEILARNSGTDRLFDLGDILRNLDSGNWRDALDAFVEQTKVHGRRHPMEWSLFVQRAGEVVGREAMVYFAESGIPNAPRITLEGWSSTDPESSLEWLMEEADPQLRKEILGAAIRGVGQTEPDLAIELLESLGAADRAKYTNGLLPIFVQSIGMDGASALFDEMAARAIEKGDANAVYLKSLFGQLAQRTLANAYTQGGWEDAVARLEAHFDQPYLDSRYVGQLAAGYGRESPEQALDWLGHLYAANPDEAPNALGYFAIMDTWIDRSGVGEVGAWMDANTSHPHYDRMATRYAQRILQDGGDVNEALQWIEKIESAAKRARAIGSVQATLK